MAKKLGITIKSLDMLESGKLPPKLRCDILLYLHINFGLDIVEIFTTLENQ